MIEPFDEFCRNTQVVRNTDGEAMVVVRGSFNFIPGFMCNGELSAEEVKQKAYQHCQELEQHIHEQRRELR